MKDGHKKERREGKEGRRKTCRREEDGWKEGERGREERGRQTKFRSISTKELELLGDLWRCE